ncbi:hypothetical protein YPPY08_4527, partial [Yersinia pestis PY-08]
MALRLKSRPDQVSVDIRSVIT